MSHPLLQSLMFLHLSATLESLKYFCLHIYSGHIVEQGRFPTLGDPLIQIIVWPLVFLTLVSIACRMPLQVPSIHDLRSLSFFLPRILTKSSSSFFSATVFSFYDINISIHKCWPRLPITYLEYFKCQHGWT